MGRLCDLAEWSLRRRAEQADALLILARLAKVSDEYDLPADRIAEALETEPEGPRRAADPEQRRAEIAAFMAAAGGEF